MAEVEAKMRNWIRRWLGLDNLAETTDWIYTNVRSIARDIGIMRAEQTALTKDEFDTARKTASDELGRRMIEQMNAEAKARKLTTDGNC